MRCWAICSMKGRAPSGARALTQVPIVELVVGGVFSLIAERMADPNQRPLVELAPSLMAFIESSYPGRSAADADPGCRIRQPSTQARRALASGRASGARDVSHGVCAAGDRRRAALEQSGGRAGRGADG